MNSIQTFVLEQPKTYIPLIGIALTWGSDLILQQFGIPVILSPEVKEAITVLLATAAAYLLRRGTVKDKDMDKKLEAFSEAIMKEVKKASKKK